MHVAAVDDQDMGGSRRRVSDRPQREPAPEQGMLGVRDLDLGYGLRRFIPRFLLWVLEWGSKVWPRSTRWTIKS